MLSNQSHSTARDGNRVTTFVSYSIAHLAEKDVMDAIPKTQNRPISIKLNAAIRPRNVPFRRRYNLNKAKWQSYAKEVDNCIANTNPVPENYEKFVNLVRRSSNKNIPRGCRTSYVCGLNDQSKDMYETTKDVSPRTPSPKTLSGLGMHYSMTYQKHRVASGNK